MLNIETIKRSPADTLMVRSGTVAGLISPIIWILVILVMGSLYPEYSHLKNFISDLGSLDAPHPSFQRLNFFQFGIANALLAVAVYRGIERSSLIVLIFQLVIGIGIFLSGIFPGHAFDPDSPESALHNLVGIPAFLAIILVPFVAGWRFRQMQKWRAFAPYSMGMTPILAIMLVLMIKSDFSPEGIPGFYQRIFLGIWILWMLLVSFRLYLLDLERNAPPTTVTTSENQKGESQSTRC